MLCNLCFTQPAWGPSRPRLVGPRCLGRTLSERPPMDEGLYELVVACIQGTLSAGRPALVRDTRI